MKEGCLGKGIVFRKGAKYEEWGSGEEEGARSRVQHRSAEGKVPQKQRLLPYSEARKGLGKGVYGWCNRESLQWDVRKGDLLGPSRSFTTPRS